MSMPGQTGGDITIAAKPTPGIALPQLYAGIFYLVLASWLFPLPFNHASICFRA
jgi:hypothetical protein